MDPAVADPVRTPAGGWPDPVDVVYIAGDGRSGSTLLSRLLGQTPGWFAAGELRYVWERGIVEDRLCECGASFAGCPYWTRVMTRAFGAAATVPAAELVRAESALLRTRQVAATLRGARSPVDWVQQAPAYAEHVAALYPAVRDVAGCQVVVDSSKLPAYGQVLRAMAGVRLSVVHLVRDPRATAHSWRRRKRLPDGDSREFMTQQGLVRSAAVWSSSNLLADRLLQEADRFLRVRYEDLVAAPEATLARIVAGLDLPAGRPVVHGHDAVLALGHAVAGNPDRHRSGQVEIRLDDAWRREMPRRDAALVAALTAPLRRKYGYR